MKLEDPPGDRRRFEIIGAALTAVLGVAALGFVAAVYFATDEPEPTATASATPSPTATPIPIVEGVTVTRPIEVRSAPAGNSAIVTLLAITDAVHVLGRSSDGAWLVVAAQDRPTLTGWVPADAIGGVEAGNLTVIAAPGATPAEGTPSGGATLSADLPDLVIARAFAQQNVLWVEVLNEGVADASGELRVSVDGEAEITLGVKPGEPLRPGQRLTAEVPGTHLQLRRNVEVRLLPVAGLEEEDLENNTWLGIVAPDLPNDLEVAGATIEDGHLVVTLGNNSPIPIAGTFTVSVRETPPGNALLGREHVTVEVGRGDTVTVPFETITDLDLTRATITLTTDAIQDADLANNTYPR
ncbi:MAG: hypothetical protein M0R75_14320 [Dehalococcoidia bacterium]|nr:hypothetical protein [Dehalococcoidia bacterium]